MEIKAKLIELFYFIFMKYGSESGRNLITFVACYATMRLNSLCRELLFQFNIMIKRIEKGLRQKEGDRAI